MWPYDPGRLSALTRVSEMNLREARLAGLYAQL